MKVDTNALVMLRDIMHVTGFSSSRVGNWPSRDPSFPEPVFRAPNTSLWNWQDIAAWLVGTNRMDEDVASLPLQRCEGDDGNCRIPFLDADHTTCPAHRG